tara:strand:+ start:1186 stop:1539 length:354 start_codon:yes stop_codon:yes gene_type:complete
MVKWKVFGLGAVWVIYGLGVLDDSVLPTKHGFKVDVGMFKYPMGLTSLLCGLIVIAIAVSRKAKHDHSNWICPKCEMAVMRSSLVEDKCPNCSVLMEPLKGFYKRHPELVDHESLDK